VSRKAAIFVLLGLATWTAGCGKRYEIRTGRTTLERAVSKAFKRNYAAAYRMTTGHANRGVIRHADVRCRPSAVQPDDEGRPWPWFCRVRYYTRRDHRPHIATYGTQVGALGCFEARSGAFVDRLPERVLGDRLAGDPLVYIRSCP
jgi:hypothetical protein